MREFAGALRTSSYDPEGDGNSGAQDAPKLYNGRWVQLAYLAGLALLSDWVCFSVAAAPGEWRSIYNRSQASLIDIFLLTNVVFCFVEPIVAAVCGLRCVVVNASALMAVGCFLRSGYRTEHGIPGFVMPKYPAEVVGTVLVGMAQPFFQCTPPLLSAVWFGPHERVLATAIAINANQLGIAIAFLAGGPLAQTEKGLVSYFRLIFFLALLATVGAHCHFRDAPPTPPSGSAAVKDGAARFSGNPCQLVRLQLALLRTPGFLHASAAFVASIGVTNAISAFIGKSLKHAGLQDDIVQVAGAGFQVAIMLGSIGIGGIVDRTKSYRAVVLGLLALSVGLLLALGLAAAAGSPAAVLVALFALGACIGPIQPISAELAVDVAHPVDESVIVAMQMVCGNLFSALTVPLLEVSSEWRLWPGGLTADYLLLGAITVLALLCFRKFNAPLKRSELDKTQEKDTAQGGADGIELAIVGAAPAAAPVPAAGAPARCAV